jgi:hypothetical protein
MMNRETIDVDDVPLGDSLAWKMRKRLDELGVGQERKATASEWRASKDGLGRWILDRTS